MSAFAPGEEQDTGGLLAADVAEGAVEQMSVIDDGQTWLVLVTRRGGKLLAYLNACPHQYLPLDFQGANIISADGSMLMCTMHGAMFAIEDGRCLDGPAMPCALTSVDVAEEAGRVRLGTVRW